jgi:hypothetical protein
MCDNWDALDPNFDGVVNASAAAKIRSGHTNVGCLKQRPPMPAVARQSVVPPSPAMAAAQTSQTTPLVVKSKQVADVNAAPGQWVLYLRKDFTDIYSIAAPNSPASSVGASFSYSNDMVAKNAVWSGQGAIFGGYNYLAPQFVLNAQPYVLGFAAGPYYTFNRVLNTNSANSSKNVDTQTSGGALELVLGNDLDVDRFNEFTRVTIGAVQDDIKDTSNLSATADFIPVYDPLLIHYPHFIKTSASSYVGIRFDPEIKIEYDSVEGKKQVVPFSNRTKSLRIGPQFGLWLVPFDSVPYLENINVNLVYHWDSEMYSRQNLHWFEADVVYKLNPSFAITANYKNGRDENTGANTKSYIVSLSSALDYCLPACAAASASKSGSP